MMIEHRRDLRRRVRSPVTVGGITLFTANIGMFGCGVEARRVLSPGTLVEGIVRLRGDEFAYSGRIVWARAGDLRLNVRGTMGIAFNRLTSGLALEGALASKSSM